MVKKIAVGLAVLVGVGLVVIVVLLTFFMPRMMAPPEPSSCEISSACFELVGCNKFPANYAELEEIIGKENLTIHQFPESYPWLDIFPLNEKTAFDAPKFIWLYERRGVLPNRDGLMVVTCSDNHPFKVSEEKLHDLLNIQKEYMDASEVEKDNIYKQYLSRLR